MRGDIKMDFISDYSKLKIYINDEQLKFTTIENFKMNGEINQHGKLELSAVLLEENIIACTNNITSFSAVRVVITDDQATIDLFNGVITSLDVKALQQVGYISMEALSYSYLLDIKQKNRSFQNKNITYEQLVKSVIADYPSAQTMITDKNISSKMTGKPFVQFKETDWRFLKRLASNFNEGLVPPMTLKDIKFYFGVNIQKNIGEIDHDVITYHIEKRIDEYKEMIENHKQDLIEQDFIIYHVECKRIMEIGDKVSFKKIAFYVRSIEIVVENTMIKYRYQLSQRRGLSQKKLYNHKLVGTSLKGDVISISKHDILIKLDIDKEQRKEDAYWFPFSTVFSSANNTGWYFMPELGDRVRLYFPDDKEENAVAMNAVPIAPAQKNPNVRYISTIHGKEIKMTPDGIYITGKKGKMYINLSEKDGIEISCDKNINIVSKENITIASQKKIDIAAEKINIIGGSDTGSKIEIDDNVQINGKQVKVNENI